MMKQRNKSNVQIANESIEKYALGKTTPESKAVQELVRSSEEELEFIDMISGNLIGQFLRMLIQLSGAARVLEVGTFTGYSALQMAEVLPDGGELVTIEMNILYQKIAERHFNRFDKEGKIRLWKGDARLLLEGLQEQFDLVFLDADKMSYPQYFDLIVPILKKGGLLVADNVLWDGAVLKPNDPKAKALDAFNCKVANDPRVQQVLLPFQDGVSLVRKV